MNARMLSELVSTYADRSGDDWSARLEARLRPHPRCPVARYLLACDCFDRGRAALAVQHMMIAYHAEPDLQSAALLAFAGLMGERVASLTRDQNRWLAREWGLPLERHGYPL